MKNDILIDRPAIECWQLTLFLKPQILSYSNSKWFVPKPCGAGGRWLMFNCPVFRVWKMTDRLMASSCQSLRILGLGLGWRSSGGVHERNRRSSRSIVLTVLDDMAGGNTRHGRPARGYSVSQPCHLTTALYVCSAWYVLCCIHMYILVQQ